MKIFRFWTFGRWVEIVIDDRLPCNSRGQLLFMQSQDKSEFWSCLLEKAYAKFHGSYESLSGGIASEAMQDFSGGIIEMIDIQETQWNNVNNQSELFSVMSKAQDRASLMTCALHVRQKFAKKKSENVLLAKIIKKRKIKNSRVFHISRISIK